MNNHPTTKPKHDRGEEESPKRHVYAEPGVKIDLVEDLKQQHKTSEAENTAHQGSGERALLLSGSLRYCPNSGAYFRMGWDGSL
jgi:hypothetical protein